MNDLAGTQMSLFDTGPSLFRKEAQPPLGPAFAHSNWDSALIANPGGSTLMFDLDKLTLADFRSMRYHPQVNASVMLIVFMIHQMDWHIECADKKIAAAVEENMRLIWTRLIRAISQAFVFGFAPNALEWENTSDGRFTFISKIKDLIPEECEVNWDLVPSSYRPRPQDFINGTIPPGFIPPKIPVFDGIKKRGLRYPIPPELTFWYPMFMENGNYYGRKLLKPAFTPWYFSVLMHLFSNRYFERFGEPVPIGRAPFDEDVPVTKPDGSKGTITGKQVMQEALSRIRSRSEVILPSDRDDSASSGGGRSEYVWDIEYLESEMRGADFERYMARLDEEISLAIFTPTLLMRAGDVGSHNLGVQHTQTWLWSLNALAGDIKEYIDRYLCERIKGINFTANAPKCEWVPRSLGKDNPETIRAMITQMISQGMAKPSVDDMGTALGMKIEEIRQVEQPPGAPTTDTRPRNERDRSGGSGPRRVGEPLATGKQIAARINEQLTKAFKDKNFGSQTPMSMGYRKRMTESFVSEGWLNEDAMKDVETLYSRMDSWLDTIKSCGDEFKQPEEVLSMFNRKLETEIESLASI